LNALSQIVHAVTPKLSGYNPDDSRLTKTPGSNFHWLGAHRFAKQKQRPTNKAG
jgi:hypothetical protein